MPTPRGKTVFVTGASGVIGQALLERLSSQLVICLVHKTELSGPNIETVRGDITKTRLGLDAAAFADLARRTDYIVHAAAETNFAASPKSTWQTNLHGTENVLELASLANAPVCHVSTAFAHFESIGQGRQEANAYEASKLKAETAFIESHLPGVIVRPSIVIGDAVRGAIRRFQGFHHALDLMLRGVLPVAPASPRARVDVMPLDIVAAVIAGFVEHEAVRGEYWVTAGLAALPFARMMTLWAENIQRLTGQRVKEPRIVDTDYVERLVKPVFLPAVPAEIRGLVEGSLQLLKYMTIEEPFPTSLPELQSLLGTPPLPDLELTVVRNIEFWARKRGFTPARVPAGGWSFR
jgi:nucleoside-diphosphate-sugar epimerase